MTCVNVGFYHLADFILNTDIFLRIKKCICIYE